MFTYRVLHSIFLSIVIAASVEAQSLTELRYDIGSPSVLDYYVDPANGSDSNNGRSTGSAFKTLTQAWNQIPQGATLTGGFRISILPGTLPESAIPNYMEARYGTYVAPIIIQSASGRGTVTLGGDLNVFDTKYLYLIDLVISPSPAGDAFHCEQCDHVLIRNSELSGGTREAQETIKLNQSQYVYIEDSNIHGASDNAIDFVSVQYGHIARNSIHNAQDWCMYVKGGSAYFRIEGNVVYDCGTGGITAGQGTGFEFMSSPWLHYEAYDVKIINNIIHDTEGAGLGVNGGYNILVAYNTLYRVGSRSHTLEVVFGQRSCDGNSAACQARLDLGGWGTAAVGGDTPADIGNKNIFIYNNLIYNPDGFNSSQHFAIYGPRSSLSGSNVPGPVASDANLQIRGNYIYNNIGGASLGIADDSGCQNSNPTCTASQLASDNSLNIAAPQLINPASGDFRPTASSNILVAQTFAAPSFGGGDRESTPLAPEGLLLNTISRDRGESTRQSISPPGAYASSESVLNPPGGDDSGDSDAVPSIRKAICNPKKITVNKSVTCVVSATDDVRISRVTAQAGKYKVRLKKSRNAFTGKLIIKKKGKYTVMIMAEDSAGQMAAKSGGKIQVIK